VLDGKGGDEPRGSRGVCKVEGSLAHYQIYTQVHKKKKGRIYIRQMAYRPFLSVDGCVLFFSAVSIYVGAKRN
jgi:hypothetical protein